MDELEYSNDALEVLSNFYNCDFSIFVEGADDIIFWEKIFNENGQSVHIEEVGGDKELQKYIDKIIEEDVSIYVAKDHDYSDFKDENISHDRIFSTYGYSIENTMYNFTSIKKIISNYSRKKSDIDIEFSDIVNLFIEKVRKIIVYDIANEIYQRGISCLGDNCCKFLKSNSSVILCDDKIEKFIQNKSAFFTAEEIQNVSNKLDQSNKHLWYVIRGHFLSNFIVNLIKFFVKKLSNKSPVLPIEGLYPLFIESIGDSDDYNHYKKSYA